eukprot:TRINITY_DN10327_c0_g1_i2.p2 TRINITY_DN10327_c0_g1~~TRINITY_DN10327_c0_g1_i2.p2  ORF type:complete len:368 (-),score=47.06 TRINITY_DN10327_c0_g1_i2:345-1448(-)
MSISTTLHIGPFVVDENVFPEKVQDLASKFQLKGWLSLTGNFKDHVQPLEYKEVIIEGQMDAQSRSQIVSCLDQLPRPTMIQGTPNTAQGALLYYLAKKQGLDRQAATSLADTLGMQFEDASILQSTVDGLVKDNLIFRQLYESESSTYTYLLADADSLEAVLIDPVYETVERDIAVIKDLGVKVLYAINTHCHADHITGTGKLKKLLPGIQSGIAKASGAKADFLFQDGDEIKFGQHSLKVMSTPGHTDGCTTFYTPAAGGLCFTGDALLIRACGRTDFQQGSPDTLYESVHSKIFTLPDQTAIYPGHDYKGRTRSSVGEEKQLNPRLTKTKPEFAELMKNLGLPYPKKIDASLPANMVDGETHTD